MAADPRSPSATPPTLSLHGERLLIAYADAVLDANERDGDGFSESAEIALRNYIAQLESRSPSSPVPSTKTINEDFTNADVDTDRSRMRIGALAGHREPALSALLDEYRNSIEDLPEPDSTTPDTDRYTAARSRLGSLYRTLQQDLTEAEAFGFQCGYSVARKELSDASPAHPASRGTEEEFGKLINALLVAYYEFTHGNPRVQYPEVAAARSAIESYVSRLREERDRLKADREMMGKVVSQCGTCTIRYGGMALTGKWAALRSLEGDRGK